jgi:hypothetical protein
MGDISIHAVHHSEVQIDCIIMSLQQQPGSLHNSRKSTASTSGREALGSFLLCLRASNLQSHPNILCSQSTASFGSSVSDWGPEEHVSDLGIKIQPGTQLYKISVEDLHPTQLCVGMQQARTCRVFNVQVACWHSRFCAHLSKHALSCCVSCQSRCNQ